MKALVLEDLRTLQMRDVPLPQVGRTDVLVRVAACGICGSDVHGYDGSTGRRRPPLIMGHEAAGTVVETGPGVTRVRVGERVTFDSTVSCGVCAFCAAGSVNLCEERQVLGVACAEYRRDGAFAEFLAIPEHILYTLPESLTFAQAAMIEAVSVAVHAARLTEITSEDTVLVFGAGMIGLLAIQAFRAAGCKKVFAADLDLQRLALAKEMGAELTFDAGMPDLPAQVREAAGGDGPRIAVEAVGVQASLQNAIACVRRGGTVTLIGNLANTVELPLQSVVTRQIRLQGSCASAGEYPECIRLMVSGAIQVDRLISAVAPLEEGPVWFEQLYRRKPGLMKVVLTPGSSGAEARAQ